MSNYFYYAPGLIIPRLVAATIMIVFARILSPADLGLYALVIVIGEYLDTIFIRWIRSGYTRLYFSFQKKEQQIDRTILLLMLPGTVFSIIFAFGYAFFDADMDARWATLLSLYVVANFSLYQGLQFLRVRGHRLAYVLLESGRSLVGFALAFILTHWVAQSYEMLLLGTQSLTLIGALYLVFRIVVSARGEHIDRAVIKEIMLYSTPLIGSFFLSGTALVMDRVLLEKFMGPAALGIYAVSYQLGRPALDMLFNVINVGGFPKLVSAYEAEGDAGAQRVLYQKNVAIALVTLPMLTFILVSAQNITDLLLTNEYAQEAPFIIGIIAISSFVRGWVRFLLNQVFLLRKTTMDIVWNMIPAIVTIAIAAWVLIPLLGVRGAALSALAGVCVESVFAAYRARKRMVFRVFGPELYFILTGCALGGLTIWFGSSVYGVAGWAIASAITIVVYGYAMKKLGVLRALRDKG